MKQDTKRVLTVVQNAQRLWNKLLEKGTLKVQALTRHLVIFVANNSVSEILPLAFQPTILFSSVLFRHLTKLIFSNEHDSARKDGSLGGYT